MSYLWLVWLVIQKICFSYSKQNVVGLIRVEKDWKKKMLGELFSKNQT